MFRSNGGAISTINERGETISSAPSPLLYIARVTHLKPCTYIYRKVSGPCGLLDEKGIDKLADDAYVVASRYAASTGRAFIEQLFS